MSMQGKRKRARTASIAGASEPTEIQELARTRDEEFWYSDGSIILVARDVEFRVYKGLLADHSPVFRDMFSLPQTPVVAQSSSTSAASVEGSCPVVHVSDSPEDLRHMLRVYMPRGGPNAFFHSTPSYSYDTISAAVRLGHKYQMPDLLDNAVAFLKKYYPTDYEQWKTFEQYGPPGFLMEHAIGVVNLARLTDEVGLLLMALLVCCNIDDAKTVVRGFEREDGAREQLTLDDVVLCYSAQTRLLEDCTRITLRVCRPQASGACKTVADCVQKFKQVLRKLEDSDAEEPLAYLDPSLRAVALEDLLADDEPRLCEPCRTMVEERNSRERAAVWEKLPEIFGLELPPAPANDMEEAGENTSAP